MSLNTRVVGVTYVHEEGGIQEEHEFFEELDELFEADCSDWEEYGENLDSLAEEYDIQKDKELSVLTRKYTGDSS